METRIALIGIILESRESVDELNNLLSKYGEYVIGRMGNSLLGKGHPRHQRGNGCAEQYHKCPLRQTGDAAGE